MKKHYPITITEVLSHVVYLEAESSAAALDEAERLWKEGEIILDSEDFTDVAFEYSSELE